MRPIKSQNSESKAKEKIPEIVSHEWVECKTVNQKLKDFFKY